MRFIGTVTLIAITATALTFAETASAQSAPTVQSQNQKSVTPRTVRIVKNIPNMARSVDSKKGKLFKKAPYTPAANGYKSKFIIHNKANKTLMPVYLIKDPLKS